MSGRPADPGYWRAWRAAHPEYRARERERAKRRRLERGREDRSLEYQRRNAGRAGAAPAGPLAPVHPHLRHGSRVSWWDEELACDLEQERALAALEGRDPEAAAAAYRAREVGWARSTCAIVGNPIAISRGCC